MAPKFYKYIVIHQAAGATFCNGFLISTNYSHSFEHYQQMIEEARKSFFFGDADVECRTVIESRWVKGCPAIRFRLPNGSEAVGWQQCQDRMPDIHVG